MPKCLVISCPNNSRHVRKKDGVSYFSFPRNPIRCSEWTVIIAKARNDLKFKPYKGSVVCSNHFAASDIYTTTKGFSRLNKNAKPILHLNKKQVRNDDSDQENTHDSSDHLIRQNEDIDELSFDIDNEFRDNEEIRQQTNVVCLQKNPGTERSSAPRSDDDDDDFSWPITKTDDNEDEESDGQGQHIDHHEIEIGVPDITEVKIEPPEEQVFDADNQELEVLDTILGSDERNGFSPFVRATSHILPTINMFAIMEFITNNDRYNVLDYNKLKPMIKPNDTKLLSGLRVQNRECVHRVKCTVHLHSSSQCGIEYDTSTHTVTRSECMCAYATCEHVAALLMWLHCVTNQKVYKPNLIPDSYKPRPSSSNVMVTRSAARVPLDAAAGDESMSCASDPLDVPEHTYRTYGPYTAKRKKMLPSSPASASASASAPAPGTYNMQVFKTKSAPKDTDTKIDESIIKCSFTRKCFYNVWRSTKGNFNEKLRHTRSIMTKAFHDTNYVIDFLPLEKKLEELCMEIQGYWNDENNREGFESKHAEWFAAVENIDMKKTKRDIVLGSSTYFGSVGL